MTQEERDWMYRMAYQFDNLRRRKRRGTERQVVMMDAMDLEQISQKIRDITARDGERLLDMCRKGDRLGRQPSN